MTEEVVEDAHGHRFRLEPIDCPTCGPATRKKVGLRGGLHHRYGLGIVSTVFRCQRCSLLFPSPFPFPESPHSLYSDPESYFAETPQQQQARIVEFGALVREIIARSLADRPSLLDVGSGRGDLLHAARLEGLTDTTGLEFAPAMVEYARDHHGIDLVQTTLEDYASTNSRTFDAVTLNAIIEHVYDPDAFIERVAKLLTPGGVLHIDTPRDPNLLTWVGNAQSRLLRRERIFNLSPTWPPYHVFGFSPRSLRILLEKHGISVESVRVHSTPTIPNRGGTIDRARSFVGAQILRVANATATASNMFVWARRS
jgi:SAM-dependent methyltransferase